MGIGGAVWLVRGRSLTEQLKKSWEKERKISDVLHAIGVASYRAISSPIASRVGLSKNACVFVCSKNQAQKRAS
jgi:ribosomal protein L14